jgi:hypothetical protein
MVSTPSFHVLAVSLTMATGYTIPNQSLFGLQSQAVTAGEQAFAVASSRNKLSLRRGRDLQTFADSCGYLEATFEQSGYSCVCGSNTLTCDLPSTCDDSPCANVEMTMTYSDQLALEAVNICIKYTSDPTGEFRDACVGMTYGSDLTTVESCVVQIEDSSGALATCTTCDPCDGMGATVNVDCSNIVPGAISGGCAATGLTGAGTEDLFGNLNGIGSGGEATGDDGADDVSGHDDGKHDGSGNGGSGNGGGSDNGNGNGGVGIPGSTSSGVFHGSSGLMAFGCLALALIV